VTEKEKKTPVKAIVISEAIIKPVKHLPVKRIPTKQVPAVHVLTAFDDLMDNFRKNFIGKYSFFHLSR